MRAANLLLLAFICAAVTISYFSFRTANRIHSLPEEEPSPSPYRRKLTPSPLTPEMAALQLVRSTVASHKIAVFSKTYCPYCRKAKAALATVVQPSSVYVVELDQRSDGDAIQDALLEVTGGRSVPRVFINGQFIGGGDDTARKAETGELKQLCADAGVEVI